MGIRAPHGVKVAEALQSHEVKAQKVVKLLYYVDDEVFVWTLQPRHVNSAASIQFAACKASGCAKPMLSQSCKLTVKLAR